MKAESAKSINSGSHDAPRIVNGGAKSHCKNYQRPGEPPWNETSRTRFVAENNAQLLISAVPDKWVGPGGVQVPCCGPVTFAKVRDFIHSTGSDGRALLSMPEIGWLPSTEMAVLIDSAFDLRVEQVLIQAQVTVEITRIGNSLTKYSTSSLYICLGPSVRNQEERNEGQGSDSIGDFFAIWYGGVCTAGNQRFAANQLTSIDHGLAILKEHTVGKQGPFAAVLACADSRVPLELVFDQTVGHIFVTRVAGNIVTPEIIASLEYSVAVLGIKTLLVLGHSSCGAVKAAMKADTVPGQISSLYPYLRQAVEQSGGCQLSRHRQSGTIGIAFLLFSVQAARQASWFLLGCERGYPDRISKPLKTKAAAVYRTRRSPSMRLVGPNIPARSFGAVRV